ncbi:MAG: thermonuclease family protein [Clostridia bacterium]|nr:thermonuclease family protein [Clostridia bacterium]
MKKNIIWIGMILVFIFASNVLAAERISVKYLKTSDGDTARFEVDGENVRVRFLGINTPEVAGEDKVEEPYGNDAMVYTKNKLDHAKKIEIEYDDNADKEDRFGRQLAWIWVDDALLEEELVRVGLAKTYMLKSDYKYADVLKKAESEAKSEKLGVWSENTAENVSTIESNETVNETEDNSAVSPIYFLVILAALVALAMLKSRNKDNPIEKINQ